MTPDEFLAQIVVLLAAWTVGSIIGSYLGWKLGEWLTR